MINCIRRNDRPADRMLTGRLLRWWSFSWNWGSATQNAQSSTKKPTNQLSIQSSRKIFQVYFYPLIYYFPASHLLYMMREVIITSDSTTAWGELCSRSTSFFSASFLPFIPAQWPPFCLTNRLTFWSLAKSLIRSSQPARQAASFLNLPEKKTSINVLPHHLINQHLQSSTVLFWIYESDRPTDHISPSIILTYLIHLQTPSILISHHFSGIIFIFRCCTVLNLSMLIINISHSSYLSLSHSLILSH